MKPDKKKIVVALRELVIYYGELLTLSKEQIAKNRKGVSDSMLMDIVNRKENLINVIKGKEGLLEGFASDVFNEDPDIAPLVALLKKNISDILTLGSEYTASLEAKKVDIFEGMEQLAGGKKITNGYAVNRFDKKGIVNIRE